MSTVQIPKFERVKRAIIEEIEIGRLTPDSAFPSETELLKRFKVSRPTLVRSLQDLVREGWIYRRQGKGTFVAPRTRRTADELATDGKTVPLFVHARAVRQSGDAREVLIHLMRGVQAALESAGYALVLRSVPDLAPEEVADFLPAQPPPAALVVEPSTAPALWNEIRARGWNAWSVFDYVDDANCVYIDQTHAGYLATRHLLAQGSRRIALLNGPPSVYWGFEARLTGYRKALAEFDVPFRPELALEGEHVVDSEAGRAMMRSLIESGAALDGVVGASDGKAIGAMLAAEELGRRIGEDLQFVSIDNTVAELAPHPLSSVAMAFEEAGRLAASLAVSNLFSVGSAAVCTHSKLIPTLVER